MGRTINLDSAGKERTKLTKEIVLAMREVMTQREENDQLFDLVAFLIQSIEKVNKTIDVSVAAWEKRDYWLKADRFRLDWDWTADVPKKLQTILDNHDWGQLADIVALVSQKLKKVIVAKNHRLGSPWLGAYKRYQTKKSSSV